MHFDHQNKASALKIIMTPKRHDTPADVKALKFIASMHSGVTDQQRKAAEWFLSLGQADRVLAQ